MDLKFEKDLCRYLDPVVREVQMQELTQEIRLTDGMPDVGRVICAWGQVILRGKEWLGDAITVSGGVMVWLLYAPEDGTQSRCLDAWIPFRMKWELPDSVRDGEIRVTGCLRFVDGRNVSPRKIMIRAGVGALAEALVPGEAEVYMPGDMPSDVALLKRSYPVRLLKEAGEKTFVLDEEITLPDSMPRPAKLICCTAQPEITERKVLANRAVFRGNGNLRILYESDAGQIHAWDFELPFSQLAELRESYSQDAQADLRMGVTSLETELDGEGRFRIKCGLLAQYLISDRTLLELVEDAYSITREIGLQMQELELPALLENRSENLYGEQTIPMDADVVVDCRFLPDFPRRHRSENGLKLELPGFFQILCYQENGELVSGTARWEGSMDLPADEDCVFQADLLAGKPQGSVGDGSISVSVDTQVKLETMSRKGLPMVTGLELGEQRQPDPNRPSLILRRTGGDGLWSLAKGCGSTVDAIREANDLQEEPAPDRILLIPVL